MKKIFLILCLMFAAVIPREAAATVAACPAMGSYVGNGSTTVFTYNCKVLDKTHVRVLVNGVAQTVDSAFTVGNIGSASGSITFVTAPPDTQSVIFLRSIPIDQESVYTLNEQFPASRVALDFDRAVMRDQMQQEQIDRSLKYAETQAVTSALTTLPPPVAGKIIGYNDDATAIELYDRGSGNSGSAFNSSAELAGILTDEIGSGAGAVAMFNKNPTVTESITTPKVIFAAGCLDVTGSGTPEGVVTAPVCSRYSDTAGGASTTFYVKETGAGNTGWVPHGNPAGSGAPTTVPFITSVADGGVSNEFALGSLAAGLLRNPGATGIPTIATACTDYLDPTCILANANLPTTITGRIFDNTNTYTAWDNLWTLQDNADATKQMKFELGGYTTGLTRTLTPPNADTHLIGGSHFAGTHIGGLRKTGTAAYSVCRNNDTATTDPGTGNDNTQNYCIDSSWANTSAATLWKAVSVGTGTANWVRLGTAATPALQAVSDVGRTITNASTFATGVHIGLSATSGWRLYDDVTLGPIFTCVVAGVENDCDWKRKLAAGKVFEIQDSAGTPILTVAEATATVTNLKVDCEAAGNTCTLPYEDWSEVAACNNATAALIFNSPTASAPAATCEGTNTRHATAEFDDTTDEFFDHAWRLPTGFTGAIDIIIRGKIAVTSGAVGMCAQLVRVALGATSDPALPAQAAGNCGSVTVPGTTLQEFEITIAGVTCTSCVATDRVNLRISRDGNGSAVTDSATGDFKMIGFTKRYRRAL